MVIIFIVIVDSVRGYEFLLWICFNILFDGVKIIMMDNIIINCFICFLFEEVYVILGLVFNSKYKIKLFFLCFMVVDRVLFFVDYVMVLY